MAFCFLGIDFMYESPPVPVSTSRGKKVWIPDFTLIASNLMVEYKGRRYYGHDNQVDTLEKPMAAQKAGHKVMVMYEKDLEELCGNRHHKLRRTLLRSESECQDMISAGISSQQQKIGSSWIGNLLLYPSGLTTH